MGKLHPSLPHPPVCRPGDTRCPWSPLLCSCHLRPFGSTAATSTRLLPGKQLSGGEWPLQEAYPLRASRRAAAEGQDGADGSHSQGTFPAGPPCQLSSAFSVPRASPFPYCFVQNNSHSSPSRAHAGLPSKTFNSGGWWGGGGRGCFFYKVGYNQAIYVLLTSEKGYLNSSKD